MSTRRRSIGLFLALTLITSSADAAGPLRWKFTQGEKLAYDSAQNMSIAVAGTEGGDVTMRTEQELNLLWEVLSVDDQGAARIRQKLDRVRVKMTGPAPGQQLPAGQQGGQKNETVEYDSQAKDPPVGGAAMAAAMFEPIMKGDFEFTITPRGEVKDVKVPEPVLEMMKKNPQAAQMTDLATAAGIQKMLMQEIVVLPEGEPKAGETWSSKMQMTIPDVGKQSIETTYTYNGEKEVDGKQQAVIGAKRTIMYESPPGQAVQVAIKEQTSDGETSFSVTDGRLSSATLNQSITIEAMAAANKITRKLDQKSKVTVRSAEAK
jgi:hypothetical protein